MTILFSNRTLGLEASPIREILALIERPGMISFAGGLPSPGTFSTLDLGTVPRHFLQYGPTEGELQLRERIADDLRQLGLPCLRNQVLILSGSQQGIDLVAKLFIDPGTNVAIESPTYLAALQVFRFFGARFVPIDKLHPAVEPASGDQPAFAYAIPTFQNPTGRCYTTTERIALARFCDDAEVPLFEDDPYRDLAYDECDRQPVCAILKRAPWIYQGSFSKTLAPGLRLGYLAASEEFVPFLTRVKQAADLHSNRISQWLVLRHLENPAREIRMTGLIGTYRRKRDSFAEHLDRHFRDFATWQLPKGGLFFWLRLNRKMDTRRLLALAIERGVAFMPGESFYPHAEDGSGMLRLNFSHAAECEAEKGLRILAELIAGT